MVPCLTGGDREAVAARLSTSPKAPEHLVLQVGIDGFVHTKVHALRLEYSTTIRWGSVE